MSLGGLKSRAARDLIQQNVIKSPVSMGRGHSPLTGPKLNSEALGTMGSHLCLENRLSLWGGGSHQGWRLLHRGPQMGLGPMPQ